MNISYNWLKEYVDFNLEPAKVAEILTFIGLEVEEVSTVEDIPGGLEGVFTAHVLECVPHPNSDHLHITKVTVGGEPFQVVCGAPNVAAGQKVLLATAGASLPTPDGVGFKIKKGKIRGEESLGMICAEDELGIGDSHEGIMVLPEDTPVGIPAREYLHLEGDTIFTIGLTPNRVDGASHIGVARDLSAYLKYNKLGGELHYPQADSIEAGEGTAVPVQVDAPELAPRYMGVTLKNVKIAESPEWLRKKLIAVGLRPINNAVDITNFILMELGQPLHAFDLEKIKGGKVVVRRAAEGEKFTTLDGVERTLSDKDLMICNVHEAMCLAGVFGGLESGISDTTTSIFLESAYFNPTTVRKSSKRHGLKTDASFRFERGTDPLMVPFAARRAVALLKELCGAEVVGQVQEFYPEEMEKKRIELDFARMEALIGKKIGAGTIKELLADLGYEFVSSTEEGAVVLAPSWMVDVYRECDVVEEVLRIYGYNNVELPERVTSSVNSTPSPDPEAVRKRACDMLADMGFMECMSNSLTSAGYYEHVKTYPKEKLAIIINPLSSDLNAMRQTLLFSGLEAVSYNLNRQSSDLKLFEMGNVYSYSEIPAIENPRNDLRCYKEEMHLSMFMCGKGTQYWRNAVGTGNYFALKGYMETLLRRFGIALYNLEYAPAPADLFSEGLEYKIGEKVLATMGTVAPARLKQFDIKVPVFAVEIRWNLLLKQYMKNKVLYKEMPKFPEVRRDLALLLDESVSYAQIRKAAFAAERKLLRNVTLFDVYRGDKIPSGKKQYAISFVLRDDDKTLTDQAVESAVKRLLEAFEKQFGAALR